jgi:hypothetical protein
MVVGMGGVIYFYVTGQDSNLIASVVHFLQAQPCTGVVFSRKPVEGAFRLADAGFDSSFAPDIAVAMRWKPDQSKNGVSGLIYCAAGALGPGQGQHASLSPSDMHNLCVASGPDFAKGLQDSMPSGNIDVAPTILWILGIKPEEKMSGRVLKEAMTTAGKGIRRAAAHHQQAEWKGNGFVWRQYMDSVEVNGVTYLDEGNGGQFVQ